ncbi:MAG: T9SS type A sorting domain-containing protein [candidate division Zixibacteria bacterium]|nr:T9SS type A sorting domain-containing protein [candidate division Zixibacteria bacterium]
MKIKLIILNLFLLIFSFNISKAAQNDVLITALAENFSTAEEYEEIFDGLGIISTIVDYDANFINYLNENIDTIQTIFFIGPTLDLSDEVLTKIATFLEDDGNLYLYDDLWYEFLQSEWFFEDYLPVNWVTCDVPTFRTFSGVDNTWMDGYDFGFATDRLASTLMPFGPGMEVVLEDDVYCGCVAAASDRPEYHIVVTEFDLENTDDDLYPNNRQDLFRKIFEYFDVMTSSGVCDDDCMDDSAVPVKSAIMSNYPNPFNSTTVIEISNSKQISRGNIRIYSLSGSLVREITPNESGKAYWDGMNQAGENVPSGIYFAKYADDNNSFSLKMTLIK